MARIPVRLAAAFILTALAGCAGPADAPLAPGEAPSFAVGGNTGNGKTSLDLIEDDYASGLLDKNNANKYRTYAVLAPDKLPPKYRSLEKGKDATWSILQQKKDWDELSASTKQEILDIERNGFSNLKQTLETPHFVLHYATQSNDAVPDIDRDGNGISDFIDVAAASWELIWQREVVELGYPAPLGTPARKFHVYYKDIPYYGYTAPQNLQLLATSPVPYGIGSAYIVVENNFYGGFPPNDEDMTGAEPIRSGALKVTQAHEFMHACQFNINLYQSGWLFESHATWAEDAVYDGVNDWHWYINRFLVNPDAQVFNRYVYGSAFFQNWLSETYGQDTPRRVWLAARTNSTPEAVRIGALGSSWEGIKNFAPAEYIPSISDFSTDPASLVESFRPLLSVTRAAHDAYPVSVDVPASTNKTPNRAPSGLGANFIDFLPRPGGILTVSFDGADSHAWRAFLIAQGANGNNSIFPIALDGASAGSFSLSGFGGRWAKATLAVTIADRAGLEVPYRYGARVQ
jgi:hypothetical protein